MRRREPAWHEIDRTIESSAEDGNDVDEAERSRERAGPILPGSKIWLVKRRRLAIAEEHLNLMGLPTATLDRDRFSKISSNTLCDLAGNAFNAGSFATAFLGMLVALPIVSIGSPSQEGTADFKFCADIMRDD